ncbi:2OG-Fe(II) oxygenase [Amphibiibacter pelophylacis]|uniref:2OG-Fe(II) oxygenase n=1 Tax=Amphibiibacter pelophylacis TaxID=1799477 RepID=A0ACC6P5D5_9BURK
MNPLQTDPVQALISDELRQWVQGQHQSGHDAAQLLRAMQDSGWSATQARQVLQHLLPQAGDLPAALAPAATQATAQRGPDIRPAHGQPWVDGGDRRVPVLCQWNTPRIVVLGQVLDAQECDELIAQARSRLRRSQTVQASDGEAQVHDARTSDGMFFQRGETDLCERIEARLARLMDWPVENGEGLQVLRYGVGAEYRPHFDYFDTRQPGAPAVLRRGGQRLATVVIYLNSPPAGGSTVFPDAGVEVMPLQGHAVFFSYPQATPASLSLHAGTPVLAGEKWVATKWVRERRFD